MQRRLDRLARRIGDATGAAQAAKAQADYEAHKQAQLDAMTDEELRTALEAHLEVLQILDAAGVDVVTELRLAQDVLSFSD